MIHLNIEHSLKINPADLGDDYKAGFTPSLTLFDIKGNSQQVQAKQFINGFGCNATPQVELASGATGEAYKWIIALPNIGGKPWVK